MSAIRLARGFTGRDVIVKRRLLPRASTPLLAAAGSGVATFALPDSAGVPADMTAETIVLPYNDICGAGGGLRGAGWRDCGCHHRGSARQHGSRPAGRRFHRRVAPSDLRARRARSSRTR